MKVLFFDCFSGISGDMVLGAFIDLGIDPAYLDAELKKLNLSGFRIEAEQTMKKGISALAVMLSWKLTDTIIGTLMI